MYPGDLQDQCKVVPAYEFPLHSMKEKEALRTGGWFKAAPVPQFQTLVSDWSTSSDMTGNAEFPLS
ncbi:hypothetical protein T12_2193 [Trichinella patagoniensis]|uniref:Uncharacterized protein n=1 Tax=Trichinella patagoniensis TaxID=990121 RepID=A0A0V0ZZ34_9BILA|nr:hypothetical protein T12_2193 [Trichinella patagoniensis]